MKKIDMSQGALFTQYFLQEGIKETAEWKAVDASAIASFAGAAKAAFSAFPVTGKPSEKQTEDDLIFPILSALGWTRDHWIAQVPATQKGRADVPDMLLFATPDDKKKANSEKIGGDRYKFGLSIVENKAWGIALDRAGKGKAARDGVPSNQILRYLSAAETQSDRRIRWGVLTNGRYWRLYWQLAKSRAENFLELDLPTLLDANGGEVGLFTPNAQEREHWIKVFVLLFRRQAFLPGADDRSFHVIALAEGRLWEERVAKSLSDLVFKDIFPALVRGLAAGDAEAPKVADRAYLTSLREAALILLYRLLFVLYAEDRNLLPVRSERYDDYALRRMREEVAQRKDHKDTLAAGLSTYYGKLKQLFRAISRGEASLGVPPYNGGLFEPRGAPLLERAELSDAIFADVLDALSRHDDGTGMRWINYRDLSVQQLGSIYEQLLEFDLTVENGSIKIAEDSTARRRSGSYYTPEELVGLIIDRTIAPLLEERHQAFVAKAAVLAKDHRPKAERLKDLAAFDPAMKFLELKVCDPAMGSGHFLVSLVDYLADAALQTMADVSATIDWAEDDAPYISPLAQSIDRVRKHISEEAKKAGWIIANGHLDDRLIVRRMILKRVIYGVDRNPMAVELAKVALWLHTFTVGAPLSFLDHHLRCGNSLFGEWVRPVEDALEKRGAMFLHRSVQQAKAAAKGMARVEALVDADIGEVKESASTFSQVEDATGPLARFLDVHHAVRWLDLRSPVEKRAVDAFYDGRFGDPVRVAAGLDAPFAAAGPKQSDLLGAPSETMSLLPTGGVTDSDVHAAFVDFLSKARTKASEERFLHWQIAYPGVWERWESRLGDGGWDGGFDAVIGNPPYVRQEMLADAKPILKASFASYDGAADLFVYFYEQGLKLLKPGGRLSYVVTNKWMKAGYGEALRRLFAEKSWLETVVDFGHAKQFFADADVFPCVIVARRPIPATDGPIYTRVAVIARETVRMEALGPQIDREGYEVERHRFGPESWVLETPGVARLIDKINSAGLPLAEYAGSGSYRGVTTGFNDAFLITNTVRDRLVRLDPNCTHIIKKYLRGQDIGRWNSHWEGLWMIFARRGIEIERYPSVLEHLTQYRAQLEPKPKNWNGKEKEWQGRKEGSYRWYEIQDSTEYFELFNRPKITFQAIQFHARYALDAEGLFGNNKTFFIPCDDRFLLAALNSPLLWWFCWRHLIHMKDEALSADGQKIDILPIAAPVERTKAKASALVDLLISSRKELDSVTRAVLDWVRVEHGAEKLSAKLQSPLELDADAFVMEVKKAKRSLSAPALKSLRDEHARSITPAQKLLVDMAHQERQLSDLVNAAYGLTPEDVQLMWDTAPPRMPLQRP